MTVPETLKLGVHDYAVTVVPDGALGDAGQVGHTNPQRGTIVLCADQTPSQLADTLNHEMTHAALMSSGLSEEDIERVALLMEAVAACC